jgi:hypothetical protein
MEHRIPEGYLHPEFQIACSSKILQADHLHGHHEGCKKSQVQSAAHLNHPFCADGACANQLTGTAYCIVERLKMQVAHSCLANGTKVAFPKAAGTGSLCGEQFWWRAVRASSHSQKRGWTPLSSRGFPDISSCQRWQLGCRSQQEDGSHYDAVGGGG